MTIGPGSAVQSDERTDYATQPVDDPTGEFAAEKAKSGVLQVIPGEEFHYRFFKLDFCPSRLHGNRPAADYVVFGSQMGGGMSERDELFAKSNAMATKLRLAPPSRMWLACGRATEASRRCLTTCRYTPSRHTATGGVMPWKGVVLLLVVVSPGIRVGRPLPYVRL